MNTAITSMPTSGRTPGVQACARTWLARAAGAWRRAFDASMQARAQDQWREFAQRCEVLQPELAKELRQACAGARHGS